jgi:preprotein translocase subunit SecD
MIFKNMSPKKLRRSLYAIVVVALVATLFVLPREDRILRAIGIKNVEPRVKLGLDLEGGTSLSYDADLSQTPAADRAKAMEGVINVITKRVNPTGTSEAVIQQSGESRIIVELPGVTDAQAAAEQIGRTAQLTFYSLGNEATEPTPTDLTGKDLEQATADIDPQTAQPVVSFTMKSGDATKKFADLTTMINQSGGRLVIVLDNQILFNGGVSTPITTGTGQMTGFGDIKTAQQTAVLLNAGALPVPVTLSSQKTIGATLGAESIQRSLLAGVIGILAVLIYMVLTYRWAGVMAGLALTLYVILNIAVFKIASISPWPIVLTLAGIAGFILSVGMAVDANILIFERMKEELRAGKSVSLALENGFRRAWSSIRDSNISTLLTCFILYSFGAPIIKGFAVTLALGVLLSMLTAVTVSRTLMRLFVSTKFGSSPGRYRVKIVQPEKGKTV